MAASKQHTYTYACVQCSPASVGLAQARPNNDHLSSTVFRDACCHLCWYLSSTVMLPRQQVI